MRRGRNLPAAGPLIPCNRDPPWVRTHVGVNRCPGSTGSAAVIGVASIGLILVSGASFAHDASSDTPSSTTWGSNQGVQTPGVEADDRQGDDTDEVDALEQEDHAVGGTPDDVNEPAEVETPDKADDGEHDAAKPAKPAKPAKAPKVHKADKTKSSDDEVENDDNQADDNDQGGDHQGGEHDGGDQGGGGHDDSGGGGDD